MDNIRKTSDVINRNSAKSQVTSSPSKTMRRDEGHIIEDVPYVNQESGFYCSYACPTMIFKYYGIDTSLPEVLYNSGVGYHLVYPSLYGKYLPAGGTVGCQWPIDRRFLASLYNLSYESWTANRTHSNNECWQEYWIKVKQCITEDIPVKTTVNQAYLVPIKKQSKHIRFKINKIPKLLMDFFPQRLMHDIVLVGYNERNQTVCYHDSQVGICGVPDDGKYIWMNLSDFRKAVENATIGKRKANYTIELFKNTSSSPIQKKEIFERAHKRNLEKLKGNPAVYPKKDRHCILGINVLKQLKKDIESGINNRSDILLSYKCKGLKMRLLHKVKNFFIDQTSSDQHLSNLYGWIAYEKQNVFQYLEENNLLSNVYQSEKKYFQQEVEIWRNLDSIFSEFRNLLMTRSNAINLIKNMSYTIDNILSIEQKIINI